MASGVPEPLRSVAAFREAVAQIPSRASVEGWIRAWPTLDAEAGQGHAEVLEATLFDGVSESGKAGFRCAWVLALLAERGALRSPEAPSLLLDLLDEVEDSSRHREILRALVHLSWTEAQAAALLEWACNVVYIPEQPAAMYHMALRVMDKATASPSMATSVLGAAGELREALYEVRTGDHPAHLKKKAALLKARLS